MSDITTYTSNLLLDFTDAFHERLSLVLKDEFGDSWIDQGVRKHFKPDYFIRVEKMLTSPLRVVDMSRSESELYGLEHLWNIVDGNWQSFSRVFQDKERTRVYLSEIVELRNNLAHRRTRHVVLRNNLIRFADNCRLLLSATGSPAAERFTGVVDLLSSGGVPWGTQLEGYLPPRDVMYSEFVGRPTELNELSDWFASDSPQILVWGYGGVGKSALAYKFARDVRDGSHAGLGAVSWVSAKKSEYVEGMAKNLKADFGDVDSLASAIWSALYGPYQEIPGDFGPDTLIHELEEFPILLVVDDFDSVLEDEELAAFLLYGLRNTPARVIYTSRQRVPGLKNLEVPSFTDQETEDFVILKAQEYGANQAECSRRSGSIRRVTNGYPLFVDDLVRHAAIIGVRDALQDWSQKKGDAAREYALRRQIEYLGHNSGEVLMALSVANRALQLVEISQIAGLTDDDAQAGIEALLAWRIVRQTTQDDSTSPAYRMNKNTSRLVEQTYRDDPRMSGYATAFRSLTGERVPEAKRRAIASVFRGVRESEQFQGLEAAREYLQKEMTGELADSPELFGMLGRLYSRQAATVIGGSADLIQKAREAFTRSDRLMGARVDTYFHWLMMEKDIAETMITDARAGEIPKDQVIQQWANCLEVINLGIQRCGPSQLLCYWAGYTTSRQAKSRNASNHFLDAQRDYAQSKEWFERAVDAPISDMYEVTQSDIYRGLVLALEGLEDWEQLCKILFDWYISSNKDHAYLNERDRLMREHIDVNEIVFATRAYRGMIPDPSDYVMI